MVDQVVPRISITTQNSSAFDSSLREKYKVNLIKEQDSEKNKPWNCGKVIDDNFQVFDIKLISWLPGGKENDRSSSKISAT